MKYYNTAYNKVRTGLDKTSAALFFGGKLSPVPYALLNEKNI